MDHTKIKPVEHKADIDKQIEIEAASLMYFDFKKREEAFREARNYVENKYKEVVEKLKAAGKY